MHCCRHHQAAPPQRHCAPVPAARRCRPPCCGAPAAGGQPLRLRSAAPAARGPTPVPVRYRRDRCSAACRVPAAVPPQRFGPGLRAPAGDHRPVPAPPGSARVRHCHRPRSTGPRRVRGHPRPATVRSAAHPRTSRPAACAAAPAARAAAGSGAHEHR
ncbi:hypothetical protein G6F63_015468 [Rhizopus arrhizus]|nr:hypothetical protein G6F63_015468 [Rhizopus arrhizus]